MNGFLKILSSKGVATVQQRIFLLTLVSNNLIYESHCDLCDRKFDVRENHSMTKSKKNTGSSGKKSKSTAAKGKKSSAAKPKKKKAATKK